MMRYGPVFRFVRLKNKMTESFFLGLQEMKMHNGKPSVLVVDDNVENLRVLTKLLEQNNYHVRPIKNGDHVIDSISLEIPDIILMDIMMPGTSGIDLCRNIKDYTDFKQIPVIFVSALKDGLDKEKAFQSGGVDYISKPIQKEEVLARINTHLKLSALKEELYQKNLELEKKVNNRQKILEAIYDNVPAAIFLKDLSGKYVSANKYIEKIFSKPRQEIIGNTEMDFLSPEKAKVMMDLNKKAIETGLTVSGEDILNTPANTEHFYNIIEAPLYDENNVINGVLGLITDITELKKMQVDLILSEKKALSANRAKSDFLAMMSHEIRTPLNVILGIAHLLNKEDLNNNQERYVQRIHSSGETLLEIINDILDLSKIESGALELDMGEFDLFEVVAKLKRITTQRAIDKGLRLEFHLDEELPQFVLGDSTRLIQVLLNLLSNAIKFTESGYVKLNIRVINKTLNEIYLKFEIKDTGIGIEKDRMDVVFQPFTQADHSITRKYGGTGLGLAISQKIVKEMGGVINVKSSYGEGSSFYFTISMQFVKKDNHPENVEKSGPYAGSESESLLQNYEESILQALTGMKILIVEDNELNIEIMEDILKFYRVDITTASNGQEAIDLLQKKMQFDGILMDIQMPVMDGLTAAQKIREMDNITQIPIIALTAGAFSVEKENALKAGMNDYVSKPVDVDRLIRLMAKWFKITEKQEIKKLEKTNGNSVSMSNTPNFDLIDYRKGLKGANNNKELYERLLVKFKNKIDGIKSDLETTFHEGNYHDLEIHAHSLKGTAAILGMDALSESSLQLEKAAESNNLQDSIRELMSDVFIRLDEIHENLEKVYHDE